MQENHELDTSGMNCPLPIIKLKKAVKTLRPGEKIRMVSTDKGSVSDVKAFCSQTGNILLESSSANDEYVYFIQKK